MKLQKQNRPPKLLLFRLNRSSLLYMEHIAKNGKKLKLLIDTGSNKNYIDENLIRTPIINKNNFIAKTVGGNFQITHLAFVNLFAVSFPEMNFFLIPNMTTFDDII
jgi:hypothetical protein